MLHPFISVTLSAGPEADTADLAVSLSFVNTSDAKAYLYRPNACVGGKLENDVFIVRDEVARLHYRGRYRKRPAPEPADYLVIQPKERYLTGARLRPFYSLHEGPHTYSIEYNAYHEHPEDASALWELKSNVLVIRA